MVLCEGCDIEMIEDIAAQNGFKLNWFKQTKN